MLESKERLRQLGLGELLGFRCGLVRYRERGQKLVAWLCTEELPASWSELDREGAVEDSWPGWCCREAGRRWFVEISSAGACHCGVLEFGDQED